MNLHEQCLLDVESEYQSLLQASAPDNTQGDKQSSPHPTVSQLESQRLSLDTHHLLHLLLHLAFLKIMPLSYPLKECGGGGACVLAHAYMHIHPPQVFWLTFESSPSLQPWVFYPFYLSISVTCLSTWRSDRSPTTWGPLSQESVLPRKFVSFSPMVFVE